MKIRFEYLYRDAGNCKRWGAVVFANSRGMTAEAIAALADAALIDHSYFDADAAGVPDLHFPERIEKLDHGWHEAHGFVATSHVPTDAARRDVEAFLETLRRSCSPD